MAGLNFKMIEAESDPDRILNPERLVFRWKQSRSHR